MLTIHTCPLPLKTSPGGPDPRMWLDLNDEDYVIVSDPSVKRSTLVLPKQDTQILLRIFHNFENQYTNFQSQLFESNRCSKKYVITNAISKSNSDSRIIFNDFLFNRTKAYYNGYSFNPHTHLWYWYSQHCYVHNTLEYADKKRKIYVAPNKTYNSKRFYREKLVKFLQNYSDLGYLGNYDDTASLFLYPQIEFPWELSIDQLEQETRKPSYDGFGYTPPHNAYYANTFISIYGETIEYGDTIAVTEKTYDPLLKGHFVLPFSTSGFIKQLTSSGFLMPEFINYSYDDIEDNEKRYTAYQDEVRRLLSKDLDWWKTQWNNNINVLRHNKNIFSVKPYDRVDLAALFN